MREEAFRRFLVEEGGCFAELRSDRVLKFLFWIRSPRVSTEFDIEIELVCEELGFLSVPDTVEGFATVHGPSGVRKALKLEGRFDLQHFSDVGAKLTAVLRGLRCLFSAPILQCSGTVRIGLFFDISETVIFPVFLGRDAVAEMAALGLELDCTCYPGSDDDDDESVARS